jgi:hypothetical protein
VLALVEKYNRDFRNENEIDDVWVRMYEMRRVVDERMNCVVTLATAHRIFINTKTCVEGSPIACK